MTEKGVITFKKSSLWKIGAIVFAVLFVLSLFWSGFNSDNDGSDIDLTVNEPTAIAGSTFSDTGDEVCTDSEGKPYVLLFSTTWCPHCSWIKDTYDGLADESFADQINLQHWELDTGDNPLTPAVESSVPSDLEVYYKTYNPRGSIPTFVFGCKYVRIGNGYESQDDLAAELDDFKTTINKLL